MDDNYNKMDEHPPLRTFAYIGTREQFLKKIHYLAQLAEEENWSYDDPAHLDSLSQKYGVLYQYIQHTFAKAKEDNLVVTTENYAIFNTGLFSRIGQKEIYMLFSKNKFVQVLDEKGQNKQIPEWFFNSFFISSAHEIPTELRAVLPPYINYFSGNEVLMYFDPTLPIDGNIEHIVEDNFDRLPFQLQSLDVTIINQIIESGKDSMLKRVKRNNRLVVPQYYNKKIMYLAPLKFGNEYIPLAIEKHDKTYRINTILTQGMAYCNARLITKPESNWLINK